LAPGKTCPIEEDINIPFIIRGPGIDKGKTVSLPTSHTDIVPTLFQLAGIPLQDEFDGEPMPVTADQISAGNYKTEHVNVEYWGDGINEGQYPGKGLGVVDGK
jgi:arylsulfatase A-like enzyme